MKLGKRQTALVFGTAVLSVALLSGVAAAAFQPVDVQTLAHRERVEKTKPPLPKLEEILSRLVVDGKLTATQREAILAAVKQFTDKVEEKRPAFNWKGHLEGYLKTSAAFLGLSEKDLLAALREGKSLAELATTRGKTRDLLVAAISAQALAKVDEAIAANKMTVGQGAEAKAELADRAAKLVDAKHEPKAEPKGRAPKVDDDDDEDENRDKNEKREKNERKSEQKMRIDVHKLLGDSLRSAIAYLGLEAKTVQEQRGKSLAEIAIANGKTRLGLLQAISAPALTKIDELKAQGKLTEEQATKTKALVGEAAAKVADTKTNVRKMTAPGQAKRS